MSAESRYREGWGRAAWRLFMSAPGTFALAGILFLLISSAVPVLGTLLAGPMWVGLCAMSLAAQRGEAVSLEQFFAPFTDARASASWLFGLVLTAILVVSSMLGLALLMVSFLHLLAQAETASALAFSAEVTTAFAITLLPLVLIAYFLFPAGFYIAAGERDCAVALRRGVSEVLRRRLFWSGFWGSMMLGHLLGMLACCVGLVIVLPWNCIAMGVALAEQDPELLARDAAREISR